MSILETLTEGVQEVSREEQTKPLVKKWERIGLLEGLNGYHKTNMAIMLENQAKRALVEASTMGGGNVEGYASVAFPLVRRVFGKLIANKIVNVQPMSLPAGLIFFLDFTYNSSRLGNVADESIFGGGRVARGIVGGILVDDDGTVRYGEKGQRALNNGYSSATGTIESLVASNLVSPFEIGTQSYSIMAHVDHDPDLLSGSYAQVIYVTLTDAQADLLPEKNLVAITATPTATTSGSTQVRRLTKLVDEGTDANRLRLVFHKTTEFSSIVAEQTFTIGHPRKDPWANATGIGAIIGTSEWELENQKEIPELNIKINQIPVTAQTRKLKATWTQELQQDINAFHSVNAESELTGHMADHIEMEINNEILEDLVKDCKAGVYFWSRRPGKFVDRTTGQDLSSATLPPDFTGNISEWYQSLLETINDLSAQIYRKVRRGGANFLVCGPEVASILGTTRGWMAAVEIDSEMGDAGVIKAGSINKTWDVYVDPNFRRNVVLVGRKGAGFLESGYTYCPYVPLETSPVVYDPESFTPRRACWTRYAKKMTRGDYYGCVIVMDLHG